MADWKNGAQDRRTGSLNAYDPAVSSAPCAIAGLINLSSDVGRTCVSLDPNTYGNDSSLGISHINCSDPAMDHQTALPAILSSSIALSLQIAQNSLPWPSPSCRNDPFNSIDPLGLDVKWTLRTDDPALAATEDDLKLAKELFERALKVAKDDGSTPILVKLANWVQDPSNKRQVEIIVHRGEPFPLEKDKRPTVHVNAMQPKESDGFRVRNAQGEDARVAFNPRLIRDLGGGVKSDPVTSLLHELFHAYRLMSGTVNADDRVEEVMATELENEVRFAMNMDQRVLYKNCRGWLPRWWGRPNPYAVKMNLTWLQSEMKNVTRELQRLRFLAKQRASLGPHGKKQLAHAERRAVEIPVEMTQEALETTWQAKLPYTFEGERIQFPGIDTPNE